MEVTEGKEDIVPLLGLSKWVRFSLERGPINSNLDLIINPLTRFMI